MPPVATFLGIGALSSLYLLLPFTRVRQWCTAAELRLIGVDAAIHPSSKALPPGPAGETVQNGVLYLSELWPSARSICILTLVPSMPPLTCTSLDTPTPRTPHTRAHHATLLHATPPHQSPHLQPPALRPGHHARKAPRPHRPRRYESRPPRRGEQQLAVSKATRIHPTIVLSIAVSKRSGGGTAAITVWLLY